MPLKNFFHRARLWPFPVKGQAKARAVKLGSFCPSALTAESHHQQVLTGLVARKKKVAARGQAN